MTKKEIVSRNIGMTFDFIRQMVDNPSAIESIPNGAELNFVGADLPLSEETGTKVQTVARYRVSHVFEQVK
ncbi:MAG: hypothetical protein HY880_09635 [Deltaproteobacteria bacterium]|nr:hypothetical protein [Deltaproteobacteria bacterium]